MENAQTWQFTLRHDETCTSLNARNFWTKKTFEDRSLPANLHLANLWICTFKIGQLHKRKIGCYLYFKANTLNLSLQGSLKLLIFVECTAQGLLL